MIEPVYELWLRDGIRTSIQNEVLEKSRERRLELAGVAVSRQRGEQDSQRERRCRFPLSEAERYPASECPVCREQSWKVDVEWVYETHERRDIAMKTSSWYQTFQELKKVGVDQLTAEERELRHLPIDSVKTLEILFQPRLLEGSEQADTEASRSGKHLGVLQRSLQNQGRLSPISVVKIQGAWVCCDGYDRLIADRIEAKRRAPGGGM